MLLSLIDIIIYVYMPRPIQETLMLFNLSQEEKVKFARLAETFDQNYRATQLFSKYLNEEADFVTSEIMNDLMSEVDVDEEFAFAMVLSSLFSLESETNPEDRRFERDMLVPAVRKLNPARYENDPYYKNIKMPEVEAAGWKYTTETYPPYRGFVCDDIIPDENFREIPRIGYFSEEFSFPAVLEDGNEWMTLTPIDLDTCQNEIASAKGKCITFGLGLGYYTYMVSNKSDVSSITVIEKSSDVIKLFSEYILPQYPSKDKIRIINADAFEYAEHEMPSEKYDHAFVDIWRDVSDGFPMYMKMKQLEKFSLDTNFNYWIEGFMLSHLRSLIFEGIRAGDERAIKLPKTITTVDEIKHILSSDFLRALASGKDEAIL